MLASGVDSNDYGIKTSSVVQPHVTCSTFFNTKRTLVHLYNVARVCHVSLATVEASH